MTTIFIKEAQASFFTLEDRVFLGEGLFETLRIKDSKPCYAALHWERIGQSAKKTGIFFDISLKNWTDFLFQNIRADGVIHGGIKIILSGGEAPRGLARRGVESKLALQIFRYEKQIQPLKIARASWLRDSANPIYQVKSINYLEAIQALRQALKQGFDEVLFYNLNQHAMETSTANFFIIHKDKIITPPLSDGILAGITRSRLFSYCRRQGIPCLEKSIQQQDIETAEAAFTTNSLQGIQRVQSIDGINFDTGHSLFEALKDFN